MGEKDITEKILLSYADVFADIVNGLLFKGEQIIHPEELVDQAPHAVYKADGVIRNVERDVPKRWLKNDRKSILSCRNTGSVFWMQEALGRTRVAA